MEEEPWQVAPVTIPIEKPSPGSFPTLGSLELLWPVCPANTGSFYESRNVAIQISAVPALVCVQWGTLLPCRAHWPWRPFSLTPERQLALQPLQIEIRGAIR